MARETDGTGDGWRGRRMARETDGAGGGWHGRIGRGEILPGAFSLTKPQMSCGMENRKEYGYERVAE